jgi:trk system potassium uptake protein TrkH
LLLIPAAWAGPTPLHPIDALFTSTSAVCVTGLITVDTSLYSGFGKLVIMLLIELGGLGLISFTTIFMMIPRKRISLVSRGIVKDYSVDEIESNPRRIVAAITLTTLGLELVGALSLYSVFRRGEVSSAGTALFDACFHAISAFCNAGFSTFSTNLEGYARSPQVLLTVATLVLTGGLGFVVIEDLLRRALGKKRHLAYYSWTVISTSAVLLTAGTVLFLIMEWNRAYGGMPAWQKALSAFFLSTVSRTAGFDSVSPASMSPFSNLVTIALMFIGGSSGSTAGGIKTSTAYILFMLAIKGTDEPSGALITRGRAISSSTLVKAGQIAMKAFALVVCSTALLCVTEGALLAAGQASLLTILYEVTSAFGTVGLSLGLTPHLSLAGKLVIILTMYAGRVGLVTMALPNPNRAVERYADFASANHIVG